MRGFEIVWEVSTPAGSDVGLFRRQLATAEQVGASILVPEGHLGSPTASSIVVASGVVSGVVSGASGCAGGGATATLNARDRNLLGLRRDLMTCDLLGVDRLLLVYGDEPTIGARAGDLSVRTMLAECRQHGARFDLAVSTRLGPLPRWKHDADRLFVQVGFDADQLFRWRRSIDYDGKVFAGVLLVGSAEMAARLSSRSTDLHVPDRLSEALRTDRDAGVRAACDLIEEIRADGTFDGVHVIGGGRHRSLADALTSDRALPGPVPIAG